MRYWLVMPCAGAGRRFGSPKQYAPLAGRTVLETALQPFLADPQCAGGALVLAADDPQREALRARLPAMLAIVTGGAERAHSVCNGLAALEGRAGPDDWVLVHDAARPCLSAADLARLLAAGCDEPHGALLAVPVADTVKRAAERAAEAGDAAAAAAYVAQTLPRDGLWLAQTPQMFHRAPLLAALRAALAAGRAPTDEAQAMEWQGRAARLVPSRDGNPKVTGTADLALAEAILSARRAL